MGGVKYSIGNRVAKEHKERKYSWPMDMDNCVGTPEGVRGVG